MSTEERFKEYLDSKFPVDDKRTRSAIIHQSYGERIVRHLKVAITPAAIIASLGKAVVLEPVVKRDRTSLSCSMALWY